MKWGVLLSLADRYGANHILQVLYYRQLEWPHLEVDGEATPLPAAVVRHFRQATAITAIEARVPVDVVADLFEQRDQYLQVVITRIRDRLMTPGIVFLDPDTGLQPTIASLDHVLDNELARVWAELTPRDVLVFYHTRRTGTDSPGSS